MALEAGTQLAGYEITGILGQGGMGVVYEATQLSLNRTVALKVLASHLGDDILFRERFVREGQIQAGIEHSHIVTVYEAGTSDHGFFIAMRLIRGPNLKDMIVSRELDPGRTLRILTPIADALDVAHEAGLIHRDIKPQNILVGGRDQAFLADFGLTKASGEKSLTKTGQFVGTFDYISPEQIKGEKATTRSDVYALAAVLYEALSGLVPFPKDSEAAVLYAHMAEDPPTLTDTRPELPASLDEVIHKGMAKDPNERFPSSGALLLEANRTFTRRTRAAFTPPRPIESPQETGIRSAEVDVSTRQSPAAPPPTEEGALEPDTQPAELGETVIGAGAAGATAGAAAAAAGETAEAEAATETAPGETVPGETAPGVTSPGETAPGATAPGAPAAPETAPGETVPGETAPGETAPGETVAGEPPRVESEPGATVVGSVPDAPVQTPPQESDPGATRIGAPQESDPGATRIGETTPASVPDATVPGQAPPAETVHAASPQAPPSQDTPGPAPVPSWQPQAEPAGATAAATAAGATDTREAPPRRAGTPVLIAAAAVLALLVIAGGYLIGSSGGGDESDDSASTPAGSSVATGGSLEMSFPGTWRQTAEPPAIPGLELRNPIALAPRDGPKGAGLGAGMTDATGPELLPASFLSSLPEAPARDDAVKLGDIDAYRYAGLKPEGFDKSLTLYVAPTTDGVATVACTAGTGAGEFLPECEDVATNLTLVNGDAYALGADEDYLNRLNSAMATLNTSRKKGSDALKKAGTPKKQSQAATSLAKAYANAEGQLQGLTVSPAVADAAAAVPAALAKSESGYRALASAANKSNTSAYNKAKSNISKADKALNKALKQVKAAS